MTSPRCPPCTATAGGWPGTRLASRRSGSHRSALEARPSTTSWPGSRSATWACCISAGPPRAWGQRRELAPVPVRAVRAGPQRRHPPAAPAARDAAAGAGNGSSPAAPTASVTAWGSCRGWRRTAATWLRRSPTTAADIDRRFSPNSLNAILLAPDKLYAINWHDPARVPEAELRRRGFPACRTRSPRTSTWPTGSPTCRGDRELRLAAARLDAAAQPACAGRRPEHPAHRGRCRSPPQARSRRTMAAARSSYRSWFPVRRGDLAGFGQDWVCGARPVMMYPVPSASSRTCTSSISRSR